MKLDPVESEPEIMKVAIDYGEWYPVYFVCKENRFVNEVELTPEEFEFIKKAEDNFKTAQELMRYAFRAANGGSDL